MPYDLHTAFGTLPDQASGGDQLRMQQLMQQRQLAAQAQIAALQGQTQKDIAGTYDQRSAGDMNMLRERGSQDLAHIGAQGDQTLRAITAGQAPEMARFGLEKQLFDEGTNLRQAQNQGAMGKLGLQNDINGYVQSMLRGKLGGQPGAGGAPGGMTPDFLDEIAGLSSIANGGPGVNLGERQTQRQIQQIQLDELKSNRARTKAQQFLETGDVPGAQAAAAEGGVALPVPQVEDFLAKNPMMGGDLSSMAEGFANKDTKMFGWDPTEQDVAQIKNERDRVAQQLIRHGYPQQVALQEANRMVSMKLRGGQGDLNAGMIGKLKATLGIP